MVPSQSSVIQAVISIGFGALAGGITNAVAIWMLFHPYTPRGFGRLKIQGAIPKNRARLAKTIGRTVGQRLLTSDDLARQLSAPEIRQAFDRAIAGFVTTVLEPERGSLREELPAGIFEEVERAVRTLGPIVADRVVEYAGSDACRDALGRWAARAAEELADRPLGELLTAERRAALRQRVEHWVTEAVASPDLDRTIGDWLNRQITRFSTDTTPLLDRLPPGLVAALERAVADYLPIALERLAMVLADPDARHRIQQTLHQLFDRLVKDLLLHQRIVARIMVTEKTIDRLLDGFERDGVEQLARLLDEPEMRAHVARSVNDAAVKFLRRPMAEHIAALGAERLGGIRSALVGYVGGALRDEATRGYVIERLDRALQSAERRTWGDLFRHLPPERAAQWLADALAHPAPRGWIVEGLDLAIGRLLDRRIGRPAAWLPEGATDRIADHLSPVLWNWIQRQIPEVVAQVDVAAIVEQKVLAFSLQRLEELIRSTTQRELDLIVRLGYVLGAVVGTVAWGVTLAAGR